MHSPRADDARTVVLRVLVAGTEYRVPFTPGPSVRDILDATEYRVASACGGAGTCGLCRVRVEAGTVDAPTAAESRQLFPEQLRQGVRLACQLVPRQELTLTIEAPAPSSAWRALDLGEEAPPTAAPRRPGGARYGVAVDLGTTHLRLALWDLAAGRRVAARTGRNPQGRFGADVLTRLAAAAESPELAHEVGQAARAAIGAGLADIFARDLDPRAGGAVGEVVVVGNTAMLALLAGRNYATLLHPDHWEQAIDCRPAQVRPWCLDWGVGPDCRVELVQPLAGFVGSDLLAGVLAVELTAGPPGSLFVDFGTNTELALWDGQRLWVTSTPGGPAFEGSGISCGMPAEPGAIARAAAIDATPRFSFEVIGSGAPRGLCGSGLIDVVAALVDSGALHSGGRFKRPAGAEGFALGTDLVVRAADVDALQRAKAGVAAAVLCLLEQAGLGLDELRRVVVAGAFGRFLRVAAAQRIGLLPPLPPARIELYGNTALAGCERLLFATDRATVHRALVAQARLINLSLLSAFDERFIDNLRLQPMRAV